MITVCYLRKLFLSCSHEDSLILYFLKALLHSLLFTFGSLIYNWFFDVMWSRGSSIKKFFSSLYDLICSCTIYWVVNFIPSSPRAAFIEHPMCIACFWVLFCTTFLFAYLLISKPQMLFHDTCTMLLYMWINNLIWKDIQVLLIRSYIW